MYQDKLRKMLTCKMWLSLYADDTVLYLYTGHQQRKVCFLLTVLGWLFKNGPLEKPHFLVPSLFYVSQKIAYQGFVFAHILGKIHLTIKQDQGEAWDCFLTKTKTHSRGLALFSLPAIYDAFRWPQSRNVGTGNSLTSQLIMFHKQAEDYLIV